MLNTKKKPLYREKGIPLSGSEKFLSGFAYIAMALLSLIAILPCLHVISKAVSNGPDVTAGNVYFWPVGFQLETVKYVLTQTSFFTALKNSLIVTGAGTLLSLFTTITTAYPLSKPGFKGRRVVSLLYVISMVFFGGMIPAYMVVRSLGLLDTYAACILPFAIVQFNMFIVKNYFESLPESVEESARIDGAGDLRTLVSIVCPMSKPVIATVGLLYAINYWNNYDVYPVPGYEHPSGIPVQYHQQQPGFYSKSRQQQLHGQYHFRRHGRGRRHAVHHSHCRPLSLCGPVYGTGHHNRLRQGITFLDPFRDAPVGDSRIDQNRR